MSGWEGRTVLVTGATGLVGSWLCRRLLDEGAGVVALVRDMDPQSEFVRSGDVDRVSIVSGRLEDFAAVERAVLERDAEVIFHLGAQAIVNFGLRAPLATFESNIAGTWNVLEVARRHSAVVSAVVVASSDKAYGTSDELPYTETMPVRPGSPYDVSKACADLLAQSYAMTYEVPVAIARCGNVFGGGDLNWSRLVPGTVRSLVRGERPVLRSDGTLRRDYVYVEDVTDAYMSLGLALLAGRAKGEAFNFSDERPLSVFEMYEAVCKAVGEFDPEPLLLDEASHEIRDQYLASGKARRELGWEPLHSLEDGLRRTVAWYRAFLGVANG